jgi:3-hydroxyisobutyrate dehydrogenase-like beta-hydroxyacid dehydrogenase
MALAINNISTCEALALGEKIGVDIKILAKIMALSTGSSWSVKVNCPVKGIDPTLPADNDYEHGFESRLMKKDVSLVLKEAEHFKINLGFAKKAYGYYDEIEKKGLGHKDIGILLHHILEIDDN